MYKKQKNQKKNWWWHENGKTVNSLQKVAIKRKQHIHLQLSKQSLNATILVLLEWYYISYSIGRIAHMH